MLGFAARMLGQLLIAGCFVSVNLLLVSLAVVIRNLPGLLGHLRRALRWWLIVSYRVYHTLLSRVARLVRPGLGIDSLSTLPRICAAVGLSLAWGSVLLALIGLPLRLWSMWPFILHGLLVGGLWDELAEPGGIRLGERVG